MKNKGFTLIELMICIAIISILASIIVPNFIAYRSADKNSNAVIVQQQDEQPKNLIKSTINDNYEIVEAVKPNKNPQLPIESDRYTHDTKY